MTAYDDSWRAEYDARSVEQNRRKQVQKRQAAFNASTKRGQVQIADAEKLIAELGSKTVRCAELERDTFKHWKKMMAWTDSHRKVADGGSYLSSPHWKAIRALEEAAADYGRRFPESIVDADVDRKKRTGRRGS